MGLEKLLPKMTSFIPGNLSYNVGDLVSEAHQRYCVIKKEDEMSVLELKRHYKSKKVMGLIAELFRDIPTLALLYFDGKELGLAYYVIATYVMDRWAYLGMPAA